MDLLRKARDLEARLAGRLDRTVGGLVRSGAREPLEIVHAIVEAAQAEIQSSGRGRRVFPFNAITVTILAPSRDVRARFDAVFADGPPLRDRIVARLGSASCHVDDLDVAVDYEGRPRKGWRSPEFDIEFARVPRPQRQNPEADSTPPRLEVTVLHGTAERRTYALPASHAHRPRPVRRSARQPPSPHSHQPCGVPRTIGRRQSERLATPCAHFVRTGRQMFSAARRWQRARDRRGPSRTNARGAARCARCPPRVRRRDRSRRGAAAGEIRRGDQAIAVAILSANHLLMSADPSGTHSYRRATRGSTRDARRAGR